MKAFLCCLLIGIGFLGNSGYCLEHYQLPGGVYAYDEAGSQYWQGVSLDGFNSHQTSIPGSYLESLQILIG